MKDMKGLQNLINLYINSVQSFITGGVNAFAW